MCDDQLRGTRTVEQQLRGMPCLNCTWNLNCNHEPIVSTQIDLALAALRPMHVHTPDTATLKVKGMAG